MSDVLLDTSIVLPFTRKDHPVALRVDADYGIISARFQPLVSVVTLGEMKAFARAWGDRRVALLNVVLGRFPVVNINRPEVLDAYAELHSLNKSGGCGVGQNDLWIGACANAAGVPVLTSDHDLLRLPAGSVRVIKVDANTGETETSRP